MRIKEGLKNGFGQISSHRLKLKSFSFRREKKLFWRDSTPTTFFSVLLKLPLKEMGILNLDEYDGENVDQVGSLAQHG